ncbi:uncharacterized protein LOC143461288 [Clavelina lepadiformis]|uniref:uncharacterized protein LOC143461288 n=1 Tax=Clavelina lepadiformis TaxID=159417 RepID=UPI0040424FB5
MLTLQLLVIFAASYSVARSFELHFDDKSKENDCVEGPSSWYRGTRAYTASGIPCQRWDVKYPHQPKYLPEGGRHNYCRNPDNDVHGLWCYTTDPDRRWEYCDVPKCPDDSLLLWTNLQNASANILAIEADPELIGKRSSQQKGQFNISVLVDANRFFSEYVDVTGSYMEHTIFYVNSKADCVEATNMISNLSSIHLRGLASTITAIAYDWFNQNLYWTDGTMNWVMVADPTLSFFTPVYRSGNDPLTSIAVHSTQRRLFFSTHKPMGSRVIATDMAGQTVKVLFKYPKVFKVTAMSIDYTDDRLYVADYWDYLAMVTSCDMDGGNIKHHYYRTGSKFTGIAAYLDYIYMADDQGRYNNHGDLLYSMWILSKNTRKTLKYDFSGEPRGLKVLSKKEEDSLSKGFGFGGCDGVPPCDHICLPRVNASRECACSMGYHKNGDTGCTPLYLEDNYLLVLDEKLYKLFEFSLNPQDEIQYGIVETDRFEKISEVTVDPLRQNIYLFSSREEGILKYSPSTSMYSKLAETVQPSSVAVDPISGHVFFADIHSQSIYGSCEDGRFIIPIMTPMSMLFMSDIKMLSVDSKNKKLYYTNTNSMEGNGQVWRMNFDGSSHEVVMENLHWPHAITIDYKRNSLFVGEAKLLMVIEIPLDSLNGLLDDPPPEVSYMLDVGDQSYSYLKSFQVYKDTLYFVGSHQVHRMSLTDGSIEDYGPRDFYKLSSLALFSTKYQQNELDSFPNPCLKQNLSCPHSICVAISEKKAKCL